MEELLEKTAQDLTEQETSEDTPKKESDKKSEKRRFPKLLLAALITMAAMGLLNLISWFSTPFCDFYAKYFFPVWENTYGRLTSLLPFSFGELLIVLAVFGLPLSFIVMVVLTIVLKGRRRKTLKIFGYVYIWILNFILVTETLNCFMLYHCSSFAELNGIPQGEYTREDLEQLGAVLIAKTNALSTQVKRDENGHFILTADNETARKAVESLGDEFKNLGGYTVDPKPIHFSFFMSQMNLTGIYFPFSMEANYNNDMFKAKLPNTICHEIAHTKGFIREDEANFIAFMACSRSDNVEYRYSGYLAALTKVRGKIFDYAGEDMKVDFDSAICDEVWNDIDGNREYWDSVKEAEDTVFDSETVGEISNKAMDTNLKMNGVEDGTESYGRMVDLMLAYFAEKGDI